MSDVGCDGKRAGNAVLGDVGNVLSIELGVGNVYVADNPSLCIETPSVSWAQSNGSYISYNGTQCGTAYMCPLFDADEYCVSACSTCGTLCGSFPISDMTSLELYKTQGCSVISGDLYIINLPATITDSVLLENLQGITAINGALHLQGNLFVTSLQFFRNLAVLQGGYYYSNNPQLVDARMPGLQTLGAEAVVEGCDRLCPARYTKLGSSGHDGDCAKLNEEFFYNIQGSVTIADLPVFVDVITRMMTSISNGQVWAASCCVTLD